MGAPTVAGRTAQRGANRAASRLGRSRVARRAARAGLVARAGFYLLLAGLVVDVAAGGAGSSRQADSHGALTVIAQQPLGWAAIALAGGGFLLLGLVRLAGAIRDRDADLWRRVLVGAQGLFYLALTWLPVSFLLGNSSAGSTASQRSETQQLLSWPGGPALVVLVGLVVIGICLGQCWYALSMDFTDGLDLRGAPRWVKRLTAAAGVVGIVSRALVFLPVGVFLVVAGIQADPQHAQSLDTELAALARQPWGEVVLGVVALGLLTFAAYSLLDARYRKVERAR